MPNCIIPGCPKDGTRLHQVEVPGSEHLLCEGHYQLLFVSGMAGDEDLRVYNAAYQAILDERRAAAKAKEAAQRDPDPADDARRPTFDRMPDVPAGIEDQLLTEVPALHGAARIRLSLNRSNEPHTFECAVLPKGIPEGAVLRFSKNVGIVALSLFPAAGTTVRIRFWEVWPEGEEMVASGERVRMPDTALHGGPCVRCGKDILVQVGVPFRLSVGLSDGTQVCPECAEKEKADGQAQG